ncbi:MAG: dTDP-glucose 4,6-dehydratase [Bryobacterales bacterium]|nr:dTDP-glucose 4,6-dehydratase [Bryobacteraceae bacterium]MDW8355361.1 dTDP-glucose 4,6-dehydratase [Bryobacterales bacterium]
MKVLVTGGAGFIGSCFIRMLLAENSSARVLNLDKLTYAGNLENLADVASDARYTFVRGDICDRALVDSLLADWSPEIVVNFAAESHVDRSILTPDPVFQTNLAGTFTLLEASRRRGVKRFVQVSTDEVYGSLSEPLQATEEFPLRPSSPYSASKAGADLLALSYFATYRTPVIVTRASNNYGPYQFPEKLIPLMITNALEDRPLPIYGDGLQVRDWLFVEDHCRALFRVVECGREGEVYNVGGGCPLTNREVVQRILAALGKPQHLMVNVSDRPGHDRRYALCCEKLHRQTGWRPKIGFEEGLRRTIAWYQQHPEWVRRVRSGEYLEYYARNYERRDQELARLRQ